MASLKKFCIHSGAGPVFFPKTSILPSGFGHAWTRKAAAVIIFACCLSYLANGQTLLSGIINQYAKVTSVDFCTGTLLTDGPAPFSPGDFVLVIQMKGAQINESNTASFGNIMDLGSAGLFEKNEISSVSGNSVSLKNAMLHAYDPAGSVQLVSFPIFTNATVTETITAKPWDGSTGGVLAFETEADLVLNDDIDVSGKGFRGGDLILVTSNCTFLTNANAYYYESSNWRGAAKGEGIADFIPNKEHGRGPQANGGGGGNDHNAGAGGGGHVSNGGIGGKQKSDSTFGCTGDFPGQGGKALPSTSDRLFLGGGGGAGHADNTGAGSSGARGGGIALIIANNIFGNGHSILANGVAPPNTGGDGAGGGGAGGTVFIGSDQITGILNVEAKGGNGGNVGNSLTRCFGPGGGGSGGRLLTNTLIPGTVALTGGQPGQNSIDSPQCEGGLSNGATAGQAGFQDIFSPIPLAQDSIIETLVLDQPFSFSGCGGDPVTFVFMMQGLGISYQWQVNYGTGWVNLSNSATVIGANSPTLTLLATTSALDGNQYRCVVNNACLNDFASLPATLTLLPEPVAGFTFNSPASATISFVNTTTHANTYLWDFGDGNTSSAANPTHVYADFGTYTVTLTATGDCGISVVTQTVVVSGAPTAAFTSTQPIGCAPFSIQFQSQSLGTGISGYSWSFPGGSPAVSSLANPTVTYATPGVYDVSLTVANNFGTNTLQLPGYVTVEQAPDADFFFETDSLTVSFTNLSTGGNWYVWDFGDGTTSNLANPVHTYATGGLYNVSLTVATAYCGSAIAYSVFLDVTPTDESGGLSAVTVFPNPVSRFLFVKLAGQPSSPVHVSLQDTQGRLLQSLWMDGPDTSIDLSQFPTGLYLLELQTPTGVARFKVVRS